jgi:hypothetical protein
MKKLKLDLETVVVESFSVEPDLPTQTGTVAGHDITEALTCRGSTCGQSCPGQNTNCVCDPDTNPDTWWENCNYSGEYTCLVEECGSAINCTEGVECPSGYTC